MEIKFTHQADSDLEYWLKNNNQSTLKKIRAIIENIIESPYKGIGKPEPLKNNLAPKWSRRINLKDRIIYEVFEDYILIHSLKGHYE